MIEYYLRPDGAYLRMDTENKIITNVLAIGEHKFIGHNTNENYVTSMMSMIDKMVPSDEQAFNAALEEAKSFLNSI